MAHHHRAGIRVAGTGFGALTVAVIVIRAHAGVALQSLASMRQRQGENKMPCMFIYIYMFRMSEVKFCLKDYWLLIFYNNLGVSKL